MSNDVGDARPSTSTGGTTAAPQGTNSLHGYLTSSKVTKDDIDLFTEYYAQWKGLSETSEVTRMPRFYEKPPADSNSLQQKLREEARSIFLQRKSQELLTNDELKRLLTALESRNTPPVVNDEKMIGYRELKEVAAELGAKSSEFLTPIVFAKLQQQDPYGRISTTQLFHYVMRKTWLRQSRIGLSLYDINGQGYLTEKDLELYISELIPTLPHLEKLDDSFQSFYVCTAVRKFMFFLDPMRIGKVRIVDILASGFLDDLLELREAVGREVSEKNWFGMPSALKVYHQYLNMDSDHNGMLSRDELQRYGTGSLTEVFVERVFQECLTYEGEMDYKAYLDFVLAMENKKDEVSLQYFFKILDVRGSGYLDAFSINYFFRAIQKLLEETDGQPVLFQDVKDEIFDMIKPHDPTRISFQDMVKSSQGDVVVNILTDLNGFYNYENREVLANEPEAEDEEGMTAC